MASCEKCGTELPKGQVHCPACGQVSVTEPEVQALKADIEEFVQSDDPTRLEEARQELRDWTPPQEGSTEGHASVPDESPVVLAQAPDEVWARVLAGWLEGEGLEVMLESKVVTEFDSATTVSRGYWGNVLVHPRDLERAREILAAFEADQSSAPAEKETG